MRQLPHTIRVHNSHGIYAAFTYYVDRAIEDFLPTTLAELRSKVEEALGHEIKQNINLTDLLVMIASPEAGKYPYETGQYEYIYDS